MVVGEVGLGRETIRIVLCVGHLGIEAIDVDVVIDQWIQANRPIVCGPTIPGVDIEDTVQLLLLMLRVRVEWPDSTSLTGGQINIAESIL